MAGVGKMDPKKYFTYSAIGGVAWAAGLTILGYFLAVTAGLICLAVGLLQA